MSAAQEGLDAEVMEDGVGGGGRTAAADVGEGRAAVGADLVLGDCVVAWIGPGKLNLAVVRCDRQVPSEPIDDSSIASILNSTLAQEPDAAMPNLLA